MEGYVDGDNAQTGLCCTGGGVGGLGPKFWSCGKTRVMAEVIMLGYALQDLKSFFSFFTVAGSQSWPILPCGLSKWQGDFSSRITEFI